MEKVNGKTGHSGKTGGALWKNTFPESMDVDLYCYETMQEIDNEMCLYQAMQEVEIDINAYEMMQEIEIKKGPWSEQEEEQLWFAVFKNTNGVMNRPTMDEWDKILEYPCTLKRNAKQCRYKWNSMEMDRPKSKWTDYENACLAEAVRSTTPRDLSDPNSKLQWDLIMQHPLLAPGNFKRSKIQCQRRWYFFNKRQTTIQDLHLTDGSFFL